ncbi:MAG TPA: DUF2142 domain-containing protein [Conexibacter sp.]
MRLAVPRAGLLCALVATLGAAAWSLILPPFQVPDEIAHYAYVEYVVQARRLPPEGPPEPFRLDLSADLRAVYRAVQAEEVAGKPENKGVWSPLEQQALERHEHTDADRDAAGYSYSATPQPPLYYLLESVPYVAASRGTALQRLALMRLVSALLAGVTALCTFLFLREALPAAPIAWSVGALGVALQPMFLSASSGVNPDALLFAASAALFACMARVMRRGLDRPRALALGAAVAVGCLGKLTFVGLLPGVCLGLLLALRRTDPRRRPLRLLALALGVAALPVAAGMALNVLWDRPAVGLVSNNAGALAGVSLGDRLSYVWQFYLPPLPGMTRLLTYDASGEWLHDFVGAFGIFDTRFGPGVTRTATIVLAAIGLLALAGLWRARGALRTRAPELAVYATMALGLLTLVALQSLALDRLFGGSGSAAQLRYLLPLLPLYGALLALAARAAGRRRAAVVGTAIVLLAVAHAVFGQLLAISRYYA